MAHTCIYVYVYVYGYIYIYTMHTMYNIHCTWYTIYSALKYIRCQYTLCQYQCLHWKRIFRKNRVSNFYKNAFLFYRSSKYYPVHYRAYTIRCTIHSIQCTLRTTIYTIQYTTVYIYSVWQLYQFQIANLTTTTSAHPTTWSNTPRHPTPTPIYVHYMIYIYQYRVGFSSNTRASFVYEFCIVLVAHS